MTLNELVDAVSRLKGWKTVNDQGVLSLAIPQSGNRKQLVAVTRFKDEALEMVRFTTRIGKTDQLNDARLRSALKLNLRMPHGCLAVDGTELVMTETRPLQTSTPETTGEALEFIARQADQYEQLIYKTDVH
jgi:hypothetical protein